MWTTIIEGSGVMAKKSGKASTPAEKRKKAPKGRGAVGDAAEADGPKAAVVEVGNGEAPRAETAGAPTTPVDGTGSEARAAERALGQDELRGPLHGVPLAIKEWKPLMAPQAMVMNPKGKTFPANTGPEPSMKRVSAGICSVG